MVKTILSASSLSKNSNFVGDLKKARKEADFQPRDRRKEMTTLQGYPWRTSAIQSNTSLLNWVLENESPLSPDYSSSNERAMTVVKY